MIVFIFPTKKQLKYLDTMNKVTYVFLKSNNAKDYKNIKVLNEEDINNCTAVACSEEAVYFLANLYKFGKRNISLQFTDECFLLIRKQEAYENFVAHGISCVNKSVEPVYNFPFVAKPNFGFGSIMVKQIADDEDLVAYKNIFSEQMQNSAVEYYQEKYFKDIGNYIVYEEDCSDYDFYSVPFIFDKLSDTVEEFPILGLNKFKNLQYSDYYWSSFLYNPSQLSSRLKTKIHSLLIRLATSFCLASMVCMAELLVNEVTGDVKLVEFSPRRPGGKLSQLIYMSTGVDLELVAIDLIFCGKSKIVINNNVPVVLKIDFKLGKNYDLTLQAPSEVFKCHLYYNFSYINSKAVALIPGGFCPLHRGHQLLIDSAIQKCDMVIIMVIDRISADVPVHVRSEWIADIYPQCIVLKVVNFPHDGADLDTLRNECFSKKLGNIKVNYVYHSNTDNMSLAERLEAINVLVDPERCCVPISSTMIRANVSEYKKYVQPEIYEKYIKYKSNN